MTTQQCRQRVRLREGGLGEGAPSKVTCAKQGSATDQPEEFTPRSPTKGFWSRFREKLGFADLHDDRESRKQENVHDVHSHETARAHNNRFGSARILNQDRKADLRLSIDEKGVGRVRKCEKDDFANSHKLIGRCFGSPGRL